MHCYLFCFVFFPSSCSLVTLDTLRLIHKTPTSTPNVTFPQLRCDDAPHLPDSSRKSTSRFKKVGISFFCCLLENGWGNPAETSCFEKQTAGVRKKGISNEYPARTYSETTLFLGIRIRSVYGRSRPVDNAQY